MRIQEQYKISRNKYKELKYFCLQYEENKKKARELEDTIKSSKTGDVLHSPSANDKIAKVVIKKIDLQKKCELIEQAAIQCSKGDEDLYKCLLQNVTKGTPYEYLDAAYCSRSAFYRIRQKFFYILSQKI